MSKTKLEFTSLPQQVFVTKIEKEIEAGEVVEGEFQLTILDEWAEDRLEDLTGLVNQVYEKASEACQERLRWEAELEIGIDFGIKGNLKLKITPKI